MADLCAGRGTKALAMAERGASITAVDLYEQKLERALAEHARLAIAASIATLAVDLTVGAGGLGPSFDRVLVDAPCTGLGTLHRRPELTLRLAPDDPSRMSDLQSRILATATGLVRQGGTLIHAVCSPTREEGAEVAERVERAHPELERLSALEGDPVAADPDGVVRIGPWSGESAAPTRIKWSAGAGDEARIEGPEGRVRVLTPPRATAMVRRLLSSGA
ncbi:MAG: hypothetical protein M5U28_00650 [Sandaracinaceae bacterium]|nr:hypothetical protein [Sandaracinaceae bacterium]